MQETLDLAEITVAPVPHMLCARARTAPPNIITSAGQIIAPDDVLSIGQFPASSAGAPAASVSALLADGVTKQRFRQSRFGNTGAMCSLPAKSRDSMGRALSAIPTVQKVQCDLGRL